MRIFLIITAAMCASAFSPGFEGTAIMRSINLQGSRGYTKLFAQGKPTNAAKNDTLVELLQIYNHWQRDAKQADPVCMSNQENLKPSKQLLDLDFCIRSELGYASILPVPLQQSTLNFRLNKLNVPSVLLQGRDQISLKTISQRTRT